MAMEKESKLEAGVPKSKLKVPPKSCIPRSAKMRMNKKRSSNRDTIDFNDAKRDTTRFLKDDQYVVTLKILNSLNALRTERPKDPAFGLKYVQITSNTLPLITRQSNLNKMYK